MPRRIPGVVLSVQEPASVPGEGDQGPGRLAQGTSQMEHGRVHRDHQVELIYDRGSVCKAVQVWGQVALRSGLSSV
jgi:hypothetical protein